MNMKFMSILLKEGRKEDLRKKYIQSMDPSVLDWILNISDLAEFNHKYTDFVLRTLPKDSEELEDNVENTIELIKDFDKYQSQFPKKDINQYVSLRELEAMVNHARAKKKGKELENKVDKVYEDDKFTIIKPETEEASCKYGSNTKWCVTSRGSGHFGRYTSGRQSLYFIINKTNSTNKNYSKVAVHFDDSGHERFWDSQDSPMSQREIDVLNYAFPELIEAIKSDYKKHAGSMTDKFLTEAFSYRNSGVDTATNRNYLSTKNDLSVQVSGFDNIGDLGYGHAEGSLHVILSENGTTKTIDGYIVYVTYKSKDERTFSASIGFSGMDVDEDWDYLDLDLEGWGIDANYLITSTQSTTVSGVRRHISHRVLDHIVSNPKLISKFHGNKKVWNPRVGGYKFSKNQGLIKQMIDYLDAGYDNGTKLDFLEYIGKLKSKVVDGKKLYSHSSVNKFYPAKSFRGHFGTFFAAAKNAGIIDYQKEGKKFVIKPGPNFDAFKSGELKAL